MQDIFDDYVHNTFGDEGQALPKFNQFEFNYKKYFPVNKQAKVLDIGIGRGEMLSSMKNWGYVNYTGVDISPSTIAFCKKLGLACEQIVDTGAWLRAHPNTFEVITLLDVLEHIPKDQAVSFMTAVKGALAPNGIVIIQTPNLQAPDGHLHRYNDFTHQFGYTQQSLTQVLLTAGFKDVVFSGFEILVKNNIVMQVAKIFRFVYWQFVHLFRMLNTNLHPKILNPVFFAVAKKIID